AAGSLTNRLDIEVTWPDGSRSRISGVQPNSICEIHESSARPPEPRPAPEPAPPPLVNEATALIDHRHTELPFDDFARQPLLHRRLSQLGPGIAWADLDGDGHDELIIGSGRGGSLAVFRNDGRGGFNPWNDPAWDQPAERDQTTLLAVPTTPGNVSLLVGTASYEDGLTNRGSARHLSIHQSRVTVADGIPDLPGGASAGPLAFADIDGDGDLDLFVGGRVVPGRYPESAPSMLLLNDNGRFLPDPDNRELLSTLGLVSGAVFSDLTGNGLPDLVLACEWGPVRILINEDGRFSDATAAFGLADLTGWWNSVATGDFNGDGRPDIIAGNWGLNSSYQTRPGHPLLLYHGSLSPRPGLDLIEAKRDPTLDKIVPRRDLNVLSSILPFVRGHIPSHAAYGHAGIEEILGDHMTKLRRVEAATLASTLFLNRGGHFEAVELPAEAQWAPVFGICVADLDGDGHEDVFLAQNFFALQAELHRQDTGRGLWLKGDGTGHLAVVPGHESGVLVHGEQRGAAIGDFDGDGRVDLAVTQNGAATRLFRNSGARPGILIRLHGPERNPSGIGAMIRLKFGDRLGPAREVQTGSGYWSQNSLVPVMGSSERPAAVVVRWPGGRTTTTPVAEDARTVAVHHPDAVEN
ncbi:MAG TPA: CRTAC1 family protein, partial [Methylomirabilota bacterium]|nr:CRTAC1 family protein [Methylomirabilota bacterium]